MSTSNTEEIIISHVQQFSNLKLLAVDTFRQSSTNTWGKYPEWSVLKVSTAKHTDFGVGCWYLQAAKQWHLRKILRSGQCWRYQQPSAHRFRCWLLIPSIIIMTPEEKTPVLKVSTAKHPQRFRTWLFPSMLVIDTSNQIIKSLNNYVRVMH